MIWNKVIVGHIMGDGTKESWDKEKEMEQRNHGSKKEMIQRNDIYIYIYIYIITYRCVCVRNTDIAKEVVNIIYLKRLYKKDNSSYFTIINWLRCLMRIASMILRSVTLIFLWSMMKFLIRSSRTWPCWWLMLLVLYLCCRALVSNLHAVYPR